MEIVRERKTLKKYSLSEMAEMARATTFRRNPQILEKRVVKPYHPYELLLENASSYFYMIDFQRMKYAYISKSIKNVLGHSNEYFMKVGLEYSFETIHPEDRSNLKQIHKKMFEFFYDTPVDDRKSLKFEYNMRWIKSPGIVIHLLQQTTFVDLTYDGFPVLDFSTCTEITKYKNDNRMKLTVFKSINGNYKQIYEYEMSDFEGRLTKRQMEIFQLIAKGNTSVQIADKLSVSVDTVKNHRKKILQTTDAKNIAEAMKVVFDGRNKNY